MDLFDHAHAERLKQDAPLAARMRPRNLDEYIGQEHIIGSGRLLRRAIQADRLGSLIFYGPPGTGKTTLARVIANSTQAHFTALNAVLSGVKQIRESIEAAQERSKHYGRRTILFVDEVHRFNKAQQDALLPWVENGTVIFVGATTENPYFEVNKALVSRSRIFQLQPLTDNHLRAVIQQTLLDSERGYGNIPIFIDADAAEHLVSVANGDARAALNALEVAVETTEKTEIGDRRSEIEDLESDENGPVPNPQSPISNLQSSTLQSSTLLLHLTLSIAEESIQRRAVLYDKEGDYHFDTISAFIKSLRGSDPDAAIYWMAKMLYAGESPRFIFRRMLIFAGEDVGLADPQAVGVVNACAQAFEWVGLPEGRFPLAQAALYLATAPKSNTTFALFDALAMVEQEADSGVPNHLKDGNRDKESFGHGEGYLYPHAYRDHWVAQQYLPTSLQGKIFYDPSDQGYEAQIRQQVARRREAQLAAMLENEDESIDVFTFSPTDRARDQWLQRTLSSTGARLADVRDRVADAAALSRHALVLDLNAAGGLLTWETLRRVPEGGVYALARSKRDQEALVEQSLRLAEIERPIVLPGTVQTLSSAFAGEEAPRFDAVLGYNAFFNLEDKEAAIRNVFDYLGEDGIISLADKVPRHTQRLVALVDWRSLGTELEERVRAIEEALYTDPNDPLVNWDVDRLAEMWNALGLRVDVDTVEIHDELRITPAMVERWFTPTQAGARPSYLDRLAGNLDRDELKAVHQLFERELSNQVVEWRSRLVYLTAQY